MSLAKALNGTFNHHFVFKMEIQIHEKMICKDHDLIYFKHCHLAAQISYPPSDEH